MKNIFFISVLFLFACSNKNELDKNAEKTDNINGAIDAEMKAIDAEIEQKGQLASSMRYTKENGAMLVVLAHINEAGEIVKLEEEFNEGSGGNNGKICYYFKDDDLISTQERFDDVQAEKSAFVERISYYKNKKAIKTIEKRVQFEEELDLAEFNEVALHQLSLDRPKSVLDQTGEFETTFQGFVRVQALNYLILGSRDPNGYVTSVRVDYEDDIIKTLLSNQEKYLNRKMFVEFETEIDPTGFQYQRYISAKFLD